MYLRVPTALFVQQETEDMAKSAKKENSENRHYDTGSKQTIKEEK